MMTIRKEQIEALQHDALTRFRERLSDHLRTVLSRDSKPVESEALRYSIERGMSLALEFSLRKENDIARFLTIVCGNFGEVPALPLPRRALAILMAYGLEPARKLDSFERWARQNARRSG